MRIPSGTTDQYIYFIAVDSTDLKTRETGLTTFTVYRSRNGAAAAAMTTPTINETDASNMPGVYELLLDEDMTIDAGDDSQEMCFHITQASMAPVTRTIELYRPKVTAGNTLGVASDGDVSGNVDGTVATVTTLTGHTAQTGDSFARIGAAGASLTDLGGMSAAMLAEVESEVNDALIALGLDHLLSAAVAGADVVDNSIIAKLVSSAATADWDTFVNTTDALQAISDSGGGGLTQQQVRDAMKLAPTAGAPAAGSVDEYLDINSYPGPRGPGVYLDDAAANTNTVVGVDGIESNPVSTIAAATTIAGSLGIQRIYLINDSLITLAQTYEGWEFVGIGLGNQVTLGSQDVDNSSFYNMTLTGTQGGTGMLWVQDSSLTGLVSLECIAFRCYLTGTNTVRASSLIIFQQCESAVPGNNTPELTFSGGATSLQFRHYSGGLQINSMGTGDVMSFESDGQMIVDATCTDGLLTVRGCCDITDNASGAVTITQSAAINQANINAECDTALTEYNPPTKAEMDAAHALLATATALTTVDTVVDAIKVVTDAIGATGTGLTAIPWNAAWDAEVESEVNDALDTAIAELAVATPTATPTLRTGLMLGYMALRNLLIVQTSGTDALEIYNDAGTKIASKLLTDAGGDYTEAEMS